MKFDFTFGLDVMQKWDEFGLVPFEESQEYMGSIEYWKSYDKEVGY